MSKILCADIRFIEAQRRRISRGEGVIVIIADVDEVATLLSLLTGRHPIISPTQESGPCVHYDPAGVAPEDGDGPNYRDDPPACAYPYHYKVACPHFGNPEIFCPLKDACYAMRDEARGEEREAPRYETAAPEWVTPESGALDTYTIKPAPKPRAPRADAWTPGEEEIVRTGETPADAVTRYREAFPDAMRTAAAVKSRWHKFRADAKAARFRPGDRVRLHQQANPLHGKVGTVKRYYEVTEQYLVSFDDPAQAMWAAAARLQPVDEGAGA